MPDEYGVAIASLVVGAVGYFVGRLSQNFGQLMPNDGK